VSAGTALVTGCAGFIGSHLGERLLGEGWQVHGVDNLDDYYAPALKLGHLEAARAHPRFTLHVLDLADAARVRALAAAVRPDVVVHLAAVAGVRLSLVDPARYVRANVSATQNVLDAWSGRAAVPLVFAGSSSVYGNDTPAPFVETAPCVHPVSPYAASKRAAELLCEVAHALHGAPITVLRFFTVYGRRQRPDLAIRKFATAILRGQRLPIFGDGQMARDFTHIDDILRGVRAAMGERSGHRVVNLGNSSPVTVNELVARLERALGRAAQVDHVERPPGEVNVTCADVRRAGELWGWRPEVPLDQGLADFAAWLRVEEEAGRNP
jgi:UDP-glucuronate 4-epimerase